MAIKTTKAVFNGSSDSVSVSWTGIGLAQVISLSLQPDPGYGPVGVFLTNRTQNSATVNVASTWSGVVVVIIIDSKGSAVLPVVFNFDLTQPILPSGLVANRSGSNIYAARNSGTTVDVVTGPDVFESRTDGDGHWVFAGYVNKAPNPFDFSVAQGWRHNNSPTVAPNAGTDPSGGNAAFKIQANGSTTSLVYDNIFSGATLGPHQDAVASVWVKDIPGAAPSVPGAVYAFNNSTTQGFCSVIVFNRPVINGLGGGSNWRRAVAIATTSGGTNALWQFGIYPAGNTPVPGNYGTTTPTATGGVLVWGAQEHVSAIDYPICSGTTSAITMQAAPSVLADIPDVSTGDIDIEGAFLGEYIVPGSVAANDGWIYQTQTPNVGIIGLSIFQSSTFQFFTNGVMRASLNIGPNPTAPLTGSGGGEVVFRTVYKSSLSKCILKVSYNGCYENLVNASGPATTAGTPTSFFLGSDTSGTTQYERRYTKLRSRPASDYTSINWAEGVIIGDSTSSSYSTVLSTLGSWIYSLTESRTRRGIASLAITGQRIDQQTSQWQASAQRGDSNVKWIFVHVGINDIIAAATEATCVSRMQTLINDINTNNPTAKVVLAPLMPFGFTSTALTTWTAFSADIIGTGGTPITGTNLIRLPLWSTLDDGTGRLLTQYQFSDGQHNNNTCRQAMGAIVRSTLQTNSLL